MYLPAVSNVAWNTAGVEGMRILSNGFVGIGRTDPQLLLDVNGSVRFQGINNTGAIYNTDGSSSNPSYLPVTPPSTLKKNQIPSSNVTAADPTALEESMKVEHQKFGFGIIKTIEGSAHNPIANILFDLNGEKKIMLNYAKLMIINS
jgi:DNA helicase-2/ATP-dependent DNA helicase PcrA